MHRITQIVVLLAVAGVAPGVLAQEDLVGKEARNFSAGDMLFGGEVFAKSLEACRGEVILIKYWGLNCGPCLASMPKVQKLWDDYRDKGLHIFHVESQNHTAAEIQAYCEKKGYGFPQTLRSGGTDFSGYNGGNGLPYAFIVGVDGKVIWQGRHDYEKVIAEEIVRVRYPGLGKSGVAPELKKSADLFGAGRYAASIAEARKKLDAVSKGDGAPLAEEAQYIIDRAGLIGERLKGLAEAAAEEREFGRATRIYERIAQSFQGLPPGDEASDRLAAFKKDEGIRKELRADQTLELVMGEVKKTVNHEKQTALLQEFAKKFSGTKAAERAARAIQNL